MMRKSGVTDSTNYRLIITTFIINESSSVFMLGRSYIGTKQGRNKIDSGSWAHQRLRASKRLNKRDRHKSLFLYERSSAVTSSSGYDLRA